MGTNISHQTIDSTTAIVQNVMNQITTSITNEAILNAYTNQHAELDGSGGNFKRCPIKITQNASTTALAFGDVSNGLTSQLDNQLQAKLKEELSNTLEQLNKGINFGQTNIADVRTRTNTYIEQNLKNIINQSIKNTVSTTGKHDQFAKINLKGANCIDSSAGIDQESMMNLMAQNIANNIVENVVKNSAVADIEKKVEQKVSQINSGLDLGIGLIIGFIILIGIFSFFAKSFLASKIGKIVIVSLILIAVGFLIYFIYKRSQPDSKKVKIK